ncbi:hypothetical protein GCM10009799_52040 [Nocardiopsis rhodophaea]|uniref:Transposase n=1 Tax=Nocardiopsis rhodophaea TaxID=280238 RepID=A0ABN2TRZ2_9ACTN
MWNPAHPAASRDGLSCTGQGHNGRSARPINGPTPLKNRGQVRGYRAWYRHITLSMAALVFLVRLRRSLEKGDQNAIRSGVWSP